MLGTSSRLVGERRAIQINELLLASQVGLGVARHVANMYGFEMMTFNIKDGYLGET